MPRSRRAALLRRLMAPSLLAGLAACANTGGSHVAAIQEARQYAAKATPQDYSTPGSSEDPWGPYVAEASKRFDVPERWIREVMRQESGGRLYMAGGLTTSPVGAMGLMQVMPGTYDILRGRYDLGSDPYDPHNNILAGTAYIREMYDLYGSPGFLAAYNAGPGRLDDYLTRNRPLPAETRNYVASIGPYISDSFPKTRSPVEQYAMNAVPISIPAGPRYPDRAPAEEEVAYAAPEPRVSPRAVAVREERRAHAAPTRLASLPLPPVAPAHAVPAAKLAEALPVPPMQVPHGGRGFHLIQSAMAGELPRRAGSAGGKPHADIAVRPVAASTHAGASHAAAPAKGHPAAGHRHKA